MPRANNRGRSARRDTLQNRTSSTLASGPHKPQRSVAELLSESKHYDVVEPGIDDVPSSPPNKRWKRSHPSTIEEINEPYSQQTDPVNMYNFSPGTRHAPSDVVDLTSSPPNGTPLKRPGQNGKARPSLFSSTYGPKKLVVKNLRTSAGPDLQQYYDRVLNKLDVSLTAILNNNKMPYSKETLYNEVMIVCRQNKAPLLYKELDKKLSEHTGNHIRPYLADVVEQRSDLEALQRVLDAWATWSKQVEIIRSIFYFLDRSYLLHSGMPSIYLMGIEKFRSLVFENPVTRRGVLQGVYDLVKLERRQKAKPEDSRLLRDAISMFHVLTVYSQHFEPGFLSESQDFYTDWAEQTAASTELANYVAMCNRLIIQEMSRSDTWALDPATKKQLEMYLEDILVRGQESRLVDTAEVGQLLMQGQADPMHQLYLLLQRRRLGTKVREPFEAYIIKKGSDIVFDEDREQEMVNRLLQFKRELDQTWEVAFEKNVDLGHALREAFETFINKSKRSNMTWGTDNPKPGEMIAKYVDVVLKGGAKATRTSMTGIPEVSRNDGEENREASSEDEDVEISKQLDQVLDLFRFVHGKAVFEAFYKRDLARRLLLGKSASSEAEKSMLTRLKSECGAGFTHNLEQMFKDIEVARDENLSYKTVLEERDARPAFDLNVNVLSSSAWPSYPDVRVNVPEAILQATANFESHYRMKHSGRKLEWKHALAHCQLKSVFPKGAKEIVVSSFQAIVLLAFNGVDSLSYSELQAFTGLDDIELKRTLQSLACAKYRVLAKSPKGKEVTSSDVFSVNDMFQHVKYRIKINQIQAKETKQENQQTHERVAADRAFETQAAIVRIMKGRKTITHPELVSEVISATKSRGPLDPADIKTNIEKLIEKDYMERDEEAHNTYSYVA